SPPDRVLLLIALVARPSTRNASYWALGALTFSGRLRIGVDRRQELGAGTGSCCTRLLNARKSSVKIEVLRQGSLDERGQHRVVETRPPFVEPGCRPRYLSIGNGCCIVEWCQP